MIGVLACCQPWAYQRCLAHHPSPGRPAPLCSPLLGRPCTLAPRSNPPAALAPGKWGEVSRDIRRVLDRFRQVSRVCTACWQGLGAPDCGCSSQRVCALHGTGLSPAACTVLRLHPLVCACLRTECPQPLPALPSAGESDGWGERARQRRGRRGRRPQREVFEQQVRLGWSISTIRLD